MEKIWFLKKIKLFSQLTDDDMIKLDKNSIMKTYPAKSSIYSPGLNEEYMYLLKTGKVRLYKLSSEGKEITEKNFNRSILKL